MGKKQNSENKRRVLSYEDKLRIMYRYLVENDALETGIRARAKFEEYPIGQWQSNMRRAYYKGTLNLDEALEEKFLELGILRKEKERETAEPLTWNEKFSIMERYLDKDENKKIKSDTVFEGYPIGVWQTTIRHLFYSGELTTVSPELEKSFFESGILRVEKVKGSGSRAKYTYEEKFDIMLQYLAENDAFKEGIHQNTVFEGKPIGVWQDNMRQRYYKGKLKIAPELEEKFLGYGILRKEKRTKRKNENVSENTKNDTDEIDEIIEQLVKKEEERNKLNAEIATLREELESKRKQQEREI